MDGLYIHTKSIYLYDPIISYMYTFQVLLIPCPLCWSWFHSFHLFHSSLFMWPQFHWEGLLSLMKPVTEGSQWMTQMTAKVLWLPSGQRLQKAIENGPFIVDLPIENGGSFHSYVNVYQRVSLNLIQDFPNNSGDSHSLRSASRNCSCKSSTRFWAWATRNSWDAGFRFRYPGWLQFHPLLMVASLDLWLDSCLALVVSRLFWVLTILPSRVGHMCFESGTRPTALHP